MLKTAALYYENRRLKRQLQRSEQERQAMEAHIVTLRGLLAVKQRIENEQAACCLRLEHDNHELRRLVALWMGRSAVVN